MGSHRGRQGVTPFEVNRVDQPVVVRDPAFGVIEGDRVVEVNVADGPGSWTCWEVVTQGGERAVVLATRHGPAGPRLLGARPMPEWRELSWDLLASSRSADEAKAWLGLHLPLPAGWDASRWLEGAGEGDEERDPEDPDAPFEYGSWRTAAGAPRLLPIGDLPAGTDTHFDLRARGIAAKLGALDLAGYELLAAATWETTLYDPAGVDQDGGQGWRVVASVWWAGRQALLVGEWEWMETVPSDPSQMAFRLLAPAEPREAERAALGTLSGGVRLPVPVPPRP